VDEAREARLPSESGTVVVEFLAVSMLVALALTVLIQLAVWVWTRNVVANAVDEGARVAAESGRAVAEGEDRTRAVLRDGLGRSAGSFEVEGVQDGDVVVLHARGIAPPLVPFLPEFVVESEGRALDEDAPVP
jgi:Flp pilus assembly protein TadG